MIFPSHRRLFLSYTLRESCLSSTLRSKTFVFGLCFSCLSAVFPSQWSLHGFWVLWPSLCHPKPLQWVRLQVLSENELHTLEAHCERNYQSFLVALPEGFGLCMSTYMWIFSIVNATVLCDLRFVVSMDLEFWVQRSYSYQGWLRYFHLHDRGSVALTPMFLFKG